ncbi:MAG: RnfABCDGE type electron transport complex subunit D [Acidimicrobiia bacterium]
MTAPSQRSVRLGERSYPVVLPSVRDPRLHLAAVIISIHILGQVAFGFRVSVPQILSAILTCFLIELVWTFARSRQIVWPASAMLTGSGVALILRVVGTERGDYWTWFGWYYFAAIAGLSLITKYLIRYRGSHVFNPSNVGLVVAFLVLGSTVVEPLDFWWVPLDGWMAAAYAIIIVGGLMITARLRLLALAATFWLTLAAGLGLLAASSHCFSAAWSLEPVCGSSFWWVVIASPELMIFLFFMITDPKTIPARPTGRVVFAACLALVSTLLMAPQTTEFGTKVALLAGLVVMSPLRILFDRWFQEEATDQIGSAGGLMARLTTSKGSEVAPRLVFFRGMIVGSVVVLVAVGIVAAGAPARETALAGTPVEAPEISVDPASLPPVTEDPEVAALNTDISTQELAVVLAENLKIEGQAMLNRDSSLLPAADGGDRLLAMLGRVDEAVATGEVVVADYIFNSLHVYVVPVKGGQGASLGFEATGVVEEVTYNGLGVELARASSPFDTTFVLSQVAGDRWLILEELPPA